MTDVTRDVELTVRFFHDRRLELSAEVATLCVPPVGDSTVVAVQIVPRLPGPVALRIALYFGNAMLQSLVLEGFVERAGERTDGERGLCVRLDYFATADFARLDELEQPALSVFTNEAGGSHWMGVFDAKNDALRQGALHELSAEHLETTARVARELLAEVHGTPSTGYLYATAITDARERAAREERLIRLAVGGWTLYDALFRSNPDAISPEQRQAMSEALRAPGLVSIARCRGEATSMPWAAIYDYRLDTGDAGIIGGWSIQSSPRCKSFRSPSVWRPIAPLKG
jgi:hypothetical protein